MVDGYPAWRQMKTDPADRAFSIWIRLRDRECKRCHSKVEFNDKGLPVSHQNSHFKGRAKESTRFMPENCDTLCGGCHMYFTSQPDEHYMWQVQTKGQKIIDQITLTAHTYKKKNRSLEAIYWRQQLLKDYGVKI